MSVYQDAEVIQSGLQNHLIYKSRSFEEVGYKALHHFRLTLKILIALLFLQKKRAKASRQTDLEQTEHSRECFTLNFVIRRFSV